MTRQMKATGQRRSFSLSLIPSLRDNISESTPWETIIPAAFFLASALCYLDPSLAPSLAFALLAFVTVFVSPVVTYFTKPATEGLIGTITDAINAITDDQYSEERNQFFDAFAALISKSLQSTALKAALMESLVTSLMNDDLHEAVLKTLQTALIKASENEGLRSTGLQIVKQAFVGALNDEDFVRDLMSSIVSALVQASKEEELTTSLLDVVTRAVSQSLADENFTAEIRGAVKDTLRDGDLYKAGAKGIVAAAFGGATGFHRSLTSKDQKR